jgi:hypothetical protein
MSKEYQAAAARKQRENSAKTARKQLRAGLAKTRAVFSGVCKNSRRVQWRWQQ